MSKRTNKHTLHKTTNQRILKPSSPTTTATSSPLNTTIPATRTSPLMTSHHSSSTSVESMVMRNNINTNHNDHGRIISYATIARKAANSVGPNSHLSSLWNLLCEDVWCEILNYLDSKFLVLNCMTVSKQFQKACLRVQLKLRIILPKKPRHVIVRQLASSPYMKNLTELTNDRISKYEHYHASSIRPLLSSTYLTNLKSLSLQGVKLSNLMDLLTHPSTRTLSNLTQLNLRCNQLTESDIAKLANCSHFKNLSTLMLGYNDLKSNSVKYLAESRYMKQLTHLNLKYNSIDNAGISFVAQSSNLVNLQVLNLAFNKFGNEGLRTFVHSKNMTNMTRLDMRSTIIDIEGLRSLLTVGSSTAHKLSSLKFSRITIDDSSQISLIEELPNLTSLEMLGTITQLWNDNIIFQLFGLKQNHLSTLAISRASLTNQDVKILMNSSDALSGISTLNLSNNEIGSDGFKYIATSLNMHNLTNLDLSSNAIGPEAMNSIQHFKKLQVLNLSGNQLGDEGCLNLTKHGKHSLRWLSLKYNQVGDKGAQALARYSQQTLPRLAFLDIDCLYMTEESNKLLQTKFNFDSKALNDYGIVQERIEEEETVAFGSKKFFH
ncbi:hypothetical protein C9374_004956 [Naegleria lovaniensis]|uniref:F-box domain-containing protein n=1 Tax=Naegleria lovaniensis TaxID=51637 RepID=A0AA88GPW6_NAELO|nr:uncharacterized protein C9374_004956 [Naegleria lovaniensis]KAG2382989.1 hypothetical protein C9374_004956 [Naegleria lovaniensis]